MVGPTPSFAAHVGVFAAAAVACLVAAWRARAIEDPDARLGMQALLLLTGAWSVAHLLYLLLPVPGPARAAYIAGLVVGFAAVGAWLYLCSAYTGRTLHRNSAVRGVAVILFLVVVGLKVSNPLHGRYFTATVATTPFHHLAIEHLTLHWLSMGLAYALAAVGAFMLLERFIDVGYETWPLVGLVALTGLPVALDVAAPRTPWLLSMTYEPLGVAAFALGTLFVYLDRFQAVQLAGGREEPVILLDGEGRVRSTNERARERFPTLRGAEILGRPISDVMPRVADALDAETGIVELTVDGSRRYFRVTNNPFAAGRTTLGRLVALTDVTHRERYREELERQNDRLEKFAGLVSHDLRNPLNVAQGHMEMIQKSATGDEEHLAAIGEAHERMETLISDLLTLAQTGQPVDETEPVSLDDLAEAAWRHVETGEAELVVDGDLEFEADPDRLLQLLENLFRNAVEHGGPTVTVRIGPLINVPGFYVEDDGPGIDPDDRGQVFETGFTTAADGTGFGLAIVREVAEAHGWKVRAVEGEAGGARFEFTGVEPPD